MTNSELFEASQKLIPGGVNSPVRAFAAVEGDPLFIARGEGHFLVDVEGNRVSKVKVEKLEPPRRSAG